MTGKLLMAALTLAGAALADRDWRGGRDSYGQPYGYGERAGRGRSADPVAGTIRDLQMVWSRSRVDQHERDHFRRAIDELQRFQYKASRGDFDRGRLDKAMDNLEDLAQADQIHPQYRRLLQQRLYDLRSLREDFRGRGHYGYRR